MAQAQAQTVFITGTDTGVGKTAVTTALLRGYAAAGVRAVGMKPVAAGAQRIDGVLRNDDALALQAASHGQPDYADINPWCVAEPLSPHIAAAREGVNLTAQPVRAAHDRLAASAQRVLVEGAGGWRVPVNDHEEFSDWVVAAGWPVVLVVGMRLGCLNHALLSAQVIAARAPLIGWIANTQPPVQPALAENLATLDARIGVPRLGTLGCGQHVLSVDALESALCAFARQFANRIHSAADSMA